MKTTTTKTTKTTAAKTTTKTTAAPRRALTAMQVKEKKGMGKFLQWTETLPKERAARVIAAALPKTNMRTKPVKATKAEKPAKATKAEKPVTIEQLFSQELNRTAVGWFKVFEKDADNHVVYGPDGKKVFRWETGAYKEYFDRTFCPAARAYIQETAPDAKDYTAENPYKVVFSTLFPAYLLVSYAGNGNKGLWWFSVVNGETGQALSLLNGKTFPGTSTPDEAKAAAKMEAVEIICAWRALKAAREAQETTTTTAAAK